MDYNPKSKGVEKIVVIGDSTTSIGFKLAGVTKSFEADEKNVKEIFEKHFTDEDATIIVMNEYLIQKLPKKILTQARESIKPVVVSIPDQKGETQKDESLNNLIKRAIGFDMVSE